MESPNSPSLRRSLGGSLAAMGVLHVVAPEPFERLIPSWLPGTPRAWNQAATAAELTSAALLLQKRTARIGGWAALGTIAGVWVANIQAAVDGGTPGVPGWFGGKQAAWIRAPLQLPLLWLAHRCTREPARR